MQLKDKIATVRRQPIPCILQVILNYLFIIFQQLSNLQSFLYILLCLKLQGIIMNSFKIQVLKQQPILPAPVIVNPAPSITMNIESMVCLNYPIQSLLQIVQAHFDDQPCSASLVIRALKVISISLKDKQLKAGLQKIISNNIYKRHSIFSLLSYWSNIIPNLAPTLLKLDQKLIQTVIGSALSQYLFTNCNNNHTFIRMIQMSFNVIPPLSYLKISQVVKNQYISIGCPFVQFLKSQQKLNLQDQNFHGFMVQITDFIMKQKMTQHKLQNMFKTYLNDVQIRQIIDKYFLTYSNITNYFIVGLKSKLQPNEVLGIWSNLSQFKMRSAIKSTIKQWVNVGNNYWKVFQINFDSLKKAQKVNEYTRLLQLGMQLDKQNLLHQYVSKQYLYNFLEGKTNELSNISSLQIDKQQNKKIYLAIQHINQMAKTFSTVSNAQNVNLLIINKIHAPNNWSKTDIKMLKSVTLKIIQPYVQKIVKLYEKSEQKCKQKGKKLQLAYHGIVINVKKESNEEQQLTVNLHQLATILKQNSIPNSINIKEQYNVYEKQKQKKEVQKQVQGIVVEAKIVRILKKSQKKISFQQLYENLKQLQTSQQNCKKALDRVINKGMAIEEVEGLYAYCP